MKKTFILSGTIILSLIIMFIIAEIFSLYHFTDIPTLTTLCYLISLFCIFEYILLVIIYMIKKKINKEKLGVKKIIGIMLLFIALMLILGFIVILDIDWLNWYAYSPPFYINVIIRSVEFLLPSIVFTILSIYLLKKKKI